MSWFTPKLEPGERVLLRNTDDRLIWWQTGFLALWLGSIALPNFLILGTHETQFWETVGFLLVIPLLVLLQAWAGSIWLWVLTDRQLVAREKPSAPARGLPLDAVEEARIDGDILHVRGGDERMELAITDRFCAGVRLREVLGDRFGDPGELVSPLGTVLAPGEQVRLRTLPELSITSVLAPLLLAAGLVGIMSNFFILSRTGLALALGVGLPMMSAILLADLAASWRRRGWWVAVTDKRLLLRRWREPGRYDAVAPDDIERAEYDGKQGRFILHCGDRALFLTCTKWSARRILKALGRDPGEIS